MKSTSGENTKLHSDYILNDSLIQTLALWILAQYYSVIIYSFRGTFRYSNCYPDAISMISCKNIDISCLITHRFTLKDSQIAFETAKNFSKSSENPTNAIKVIIKCNDS